MKFSKRIYSTLLIIAFIVVLAAIKWYDTSIGLPATVMQVVRFIQPLFYGVLIAALVHLLVFVGLSFFIPSSPKEAWWEEKIPAKKDKVFTLLVKGLFISVPVLMYGFLTWAILMNPWKMWFFWMVMFGVMRLFRLVVKKMSHHKLIS